MSSPPACLPRPGLLYGAYPQRDGRQRSAWLALADGAGDLLAGGRRSREPWPRTLERARRALARDAQPFERQLAGLRARLLREGLTPDLAATAQVLVARTIHDVQDRRPYPEQHVAAWAMLRDRLVEMDTGEGKSLAVLMAAATAALASMPVHVITANDYLAGRDAQAARPVLERLGLTVAAIAPGMDATARRAAYAQAVVYATAREIGFDYLRDRMLAGTRTAPVLRGLCLALVDEADSVLIDHAGTPLIVATPAAGPAASAAAVRTALAGCLYDFSARLQPGVDFQLVAETRSAELAPHIADALQAHLAASRLTVTDVRVARHLLAQALVVRHLLQRDRHYIVQFHEGTAQVVLIDETTGRVLPGTQWTGGIHALVALKEGCAAPAAVQTQRQITLQSLFARYWKLGGISGTLRESRLEFFAFYRLLVQRLPPRRPTRRHDLGLRLYGSQPRQFDAVCRRVMACRAATQPVLIGTDSVATSEALAAHLRAAGLPVTVLNACHDADEAALIAAAGRPGAITVTTNMAGRGTDIAVHDRVAHLGLHVIACALNASRRIDRQLAGRTARNGTAGSCEAILCAADPVFLRWLPASVASACARDTGAGGLPRFAARALAAGVQQLQAIADLLQRARGARHDRQMQELLAYARDAGLPAPLHRPVS